MRVTELLTEYKKFESDEARALYAETSKRWKSTLQKIHSLYNGYAAVSGFLCKYKGDSMFDITLPRGGGWTADDFEEDILAVATAKFFKQDGWDIKIESIDREGWRNGGVQLDVSLTPQGETLELLKKIPGISVSYAIRKRKKK